MPEPTSQTPTARPDPLVYNVLPKNVSRYIVTSRVLNSFLQERYGKSIDFQVTHRNERWTFWAPEMVDEEGIKEYIDKLQAIVEKKKAAAREAAREKAVAGG